MSLEAIEDDCWGPPTGTTTRLVAECHRLRTIPLPHPDLIDPVTNAITTFRSTTRGL
ncbi:hypothetical protein [Actinokineospora globicatena]|uniref:hypothetical protein n=1 Tax=Actinokineospora globicatena TaxID=103729 RepID=UPI0020A4E781|nr:hypothetical protein [Actinokineospora globicatena]MCP2302262.1 hypothetical protein [Actinokineospora globicatena]GLW76072.1 hypothetical protein Aglo01_05540 [Actinokineospora globicatena]GLW82907.1 hypothetical protein Aglo02_05470 [Actinokineospora globicatena]